MEHVLDNPVWNALISNNKPLAHGNHEIKYFDKEVSPFVALKENTSEHFRLLHQLLPRNGPVLFVSTVEIEIPEQWKILRVIQGFQMVSNNETDLKDVTINLTPLTAEHVPQMLALTKLTNPGPFESRTIEFGHYLGVFEGDQLVAMTGQRLHPFNYAEVSAVCTHPDHLGKGYAGQLLLHHMHRIRKTHEIPFLHVRSDNERAIKVYERLGFSIRTKVYFYLMQKADK